jgi:energy-coupling factor transporter ATP-binding protein EcfA2
MLSGGEKALVALAFVFAVFRARPSPFYILDEVEAALDDANIDRFLQLVRRFSGRAQFVIVTHQKRTMDAADVLYGVSMGKGGITKVISRRLSHSDEAGGEAAEAAEAALARWTTRRALDTWRALALLAQGFRPGRRYGRRAARRRSRTSGAGEARRPSPPARVCRRAGRRCRPSSLEPLRAARRRPGNGSRRR